MPSERPTSTNTRSRNGKSNRSIPFAITETSPRNTIPVVNSQTGKRTCEPRCSRTKMYIAL